MEQISDAGEFQRDEDAGERVGDDREAGPGDRQPDEVADDIASDEGRDSRQAVREHPRDQRRHTGSRRGDGGEIDRREQQQRRHRHRTPLPGRRIADPQPNLRIKTGAARAVKPELRRRGAALGNRHEIDYAAPAAAIAASGTDDMRVSFEGGRINERGVAVALFDYAHHARALLGVEPVVLHDARVAPDAGHLARFAEAFPTFGYQSEDEMQRLIEREAIDVAYFLKTRRGDSRVARSCRTAVHEVFKFFNPHGDSYAYISQSLADAMTGGRYPAVPHIVDPPRPQANLRVALGIPADAFVVGRHGAPDQFNIPFAPRAIEAALETRKNLWVLLLNTGRFTDHERVVHLPVTPDRQGVVDFVASCDIGLNGRLAGENFGLAIAEFLAQDKPALVWAGGRDRNHLALVDDPRFVFRTGADLTQKLRELEPADWSGVWAARVAPYTPAAVMATFATTFLRSEPQQFPRLPPGFNLLRSGKTRVRRLRDRLWCTL